MSDHEPQRHDLDDWQQDAAQQRLQKRRKGCLRFFALLTALFFLLLSYGGIIRLLKLPTLPLVAKSIQLNQNDTVRTWRTAVVSVTADDRRGTGVVLSPGHHVLTNAHIIEDASQVTLQFGSGLPSVTTSDFVLDPRLDLCLINLETETAGLELAQSPELTESSSLYMIGNPQGYFQITSQVDYIGMVHDASWPEPLLAVRGPIYKGNSGSPLIQADGEIVGILFATTTLQLVDQGETAAGLVIPASILAAFAASADTEAD